MPVALSAWFDRSSVKPGAESRGHLVVELSATGEPVEGTRPQAATVLAIDVSGSMKGEPLAQVIRSVDMLLDALRPEDRVGVVAFSDGATSVTAPVRVDAEGKRVVRARVARLAANGNTNVEAGLELAASELAAVRGDDPHARRAVVLLSDGVPNRGRALPDDLREVVRRHRPGITFASLGYGVDHNEDILAAVGDAGGGGYAFVPDPATCVRAFARVLGAQADVVASAVEITIAPGDGVEIAGFVGREQTRFAKDGIVVALGDMVPGTKRVLVAEVVLRAPGDAFLKDVARVSLRYQGPGAAPADRAVTVEIADREPALVPEAAARVMLARADVARDEARGLADRRQFAAAAGRIRAVLAEIERVPGFVQADGSPLAEAYELLVDDAMAFERKPSEEEYAYYRKASMVGSKLVAPAAASSRSVAGSKLLGHAAGNYPVAVLVVEKGPAVGVRHRLGEECVIGRTLEADIPILSHSVSRRHAEVFALEGEFWLTDLGSTNTTEVNGKRVAREPAKLRHGDVIRVGEVELRYEELPAEDPRTSP
jgi:Ca-activated chloride channel family protein